MLSFSGQKSLSHTQIGLCKGFNSNFPTSTPPPHPPLIWEFLLPPPEHEPVQVVYYLVVVESLSSWVGLSWQNESSVEEDVKGLLVAVAFHVERVTLRIEQHLTLLQHDVKLTPPDPVSLYSGSKRSV